MPSSALRSVTPLPVTFLVALFLVGGALAGCELVLALGRLPTAERPENPRSELNPAVDFLFVVDNSGSMCDDQDALVRAFFDADCPIQDLDQVPPALQHPSPELADELSGECGFAQLMAAYDFDYRVGVISTDVGPCDNRYGIADDPYLGPLTCRSDKDWGRRPQRGCLQAPSSLGQKFLTHKDSAIGSKFAALIHSVGVYGSAFERGLDAVDIFLGDAEDKEASCVDDADAFLRPDARLVLVFISDEDDCSHQDGAFGLDDENAGESCDNAFEELSLENPRDCYERLDALAPVSDYVERWRALRGDNVAAIVLGGLVPGEDGALVAGGCITLEDGTISAQCTATGGNSNNTGPGGLCDPAAIDEPCCVADGASRYLQAVQALGPRGAAGSICGGSFRDVLKQALFVAL